LLPLYIFPVRRRRAMACATVCTVMMAAVLVNSSCSPPHGNAYRHRHRRRHRHTGTCASV
jgi:hypothetical protein